MISVCDFLLTNPDPNVKISTIGCRVEQDHWYELI